MADVRDEILSYVSREGPVLPAQISKNFNIDILFSGALLSELVSHKKLKVSFTKKGSSPFYFAQGQESKLETISQYLKGKPKEAYDLLKEKKVIRDNTAEPWQRVALREIRDYALPFQVTVNDQPEIFWKWYLMPNEEVTNLVGEIMGKSPKVKVPEEKIVEEKKEEPVEKPREIAQAKEKVLGEKEEKIVEEKTETKIEQINLFDAVKKYFEEREVYVISKEVVRKDKEANFVVDVPSNLGKLRYFVKLKDKKTVNDKDIDKALGDSDERGLPLLFLTRGNLTKKAQKTLSTNPSGSLIFESL